jgi:dinuclear metal center YbgI/SA1388 family protein
MGYNKKAIMQISNIIEVLEKLAPPALQESYDNAGLLTGHSSWPCTGVLCTLDVTTHVVNEAKARNCNLIVAHHPIIFGGLKKLNGSNYVEQTVIQAIKNDIAIYAIHTNLDNILTGVNHKIADKLGLVNRKILAPKSGVLYKLYTFVPLSHAQAVQDALFQAGAGHIGQYSECSFTVAGTGTFKGNQGTNPFVGQPGQRHTENEQKLEVVFPAWLKQAVVKALLKAHPYEEVAYDIIQLANDYEQVGSGLIATLPQEMEENVFLHMLKTAFGLQVIRHTPLLGKPVKKVALCGGAGSFLTKKAIAAGADVYITGDVKYHEFFDADNRLLLADIGHWESEQYTVEWLIDILQYNFPTFAVLKTAVKTNPVQYFI